MAEGGNVYTANCQYCHGDKLDGKGPYAQGLNPVPLNFQDIGTIAQLQESFLFWAHRYRRTRIAQRSDTMVVLHACVAGFFKRRRNLESYPVPV